MQKTKQLPHYYAKPTWENNIGYLVDSRGNRLPGITSILETTKPKTEKQHLINWQKKVGKTQANQIYQTARKRGILIHKQIQNYLQNKPISCPSSIETYWDKILPFLENIHKIKLLEGQVFHYYEGYSGRVDCVASFYNIPCVIEFKSANRIKPLADEPLQLAAYCGAINRQYGLRLNNALLIVTTPQEAIATWFEPDEVMKYWHQWQKRVGDFWQLQGVA
ncbi:MAG: exonuclease [Microcoleaceae cyanobacterium MO_207.B10]|nr:exonuclease [Microcoleaceae cyanobacterium MO_207.B10]